MKNSNQKTHSLFFALVMGIVLLIYCPIMKAATFQIGWDAVSPAPTGYRVYYGTISKSYVLLADVQSGTLCPVTLSAGTYYFVTTAYNNAGESGYSNELSITISAGDVVFSTCDVSHDGAVNASDLSLLQTAILSANNQSLCDINHDGVINACDYQILSNLINGAGLCP